MRVRTRKGKGRSEGGEVGRRAGGQGAGRVLVGCAECRGCVVGVVSVAVVASVAGVVHAAVDAGVAGCGSKEGGD